MGVNEVTGVMYSAHAVGLRGAAVVTLAAAQPPGPACWGLGLHGQKVGQNHFQFTPPPASQAGLLQ